MMEYTKEQQTIINSNSTNILVNAGPGMGKTHLLLGIAKKYNNQTKGLLCFNAPIRKEIIDKVNKNDIDMIDVNTFHSLAFKALLQRGEINNFKNRNFNSPLDYFSMLKIMNDLKIENDNQFIINRLLELIKNFCKSDLTFEVFFKDINEKELVLQILNYLLNNPKAPMFHEVYIKVYQLILLNSKIQNYNCLMIDEYQDVSPCYLSIINNINKEKIVKVGDTLQKIYGYNGALGMEGHDFKLSKSFRIGPDTANICNRLIDIFIGNENLHINGVNKNQKICHINSDEKKTIIFRTNKELMKRLIKETKNKNKCIISNNLYEELQHIYKLSNVSIFFPYTFRGIKFTNKDMIYKWYQKSNNQVLKKTIEFMEEYQETTNRVLYEVLQNITVEQDEGNIYLTTTHRSKGLEFENVELADDFPTIHELLRKRNQYIDCTDEIYILYVALTRSYGKLQLNKDLEHFINGGI